MPKRIALIAFKYPPYDQVGAKRWTKLSKYLAQEGYEIDVITTAWARGETGMQDITSQNIRVHRVACPGLHRLWVARFDRSTFGGRAGWFVERVLTRFVRGWPVLEEARYWGRMVPAALSAIDRRGIGTVVVTGAPFHAVRLAARIKRARPGVRFVVDYRDPWVADASRTDARTLKALAAEREVLRIADEVVTVTQGLADMLKERGAGTITVIRNGCDVAELPAMRTSGPRPPVLMHAGNVYVGREKPLAALLRVVRANARSFPELRMVFYGGFPAHLEREYADLCESGMLSVRERIAPAELMEHIDAAFACLHFNADTAPFALSTKIFEYACAGRPTLSLNYGGEIDDLMRSHALGWSADASSDHAILEQLEALVATWRTDPGMEIDGAVRDEFAYRHIARQWARLLDSSAGHQR